MIKISVSDRANLPIYKQIVEQVKQLIANNQLKPGDRMPTVRELAAFLQINPATVARAYQELEQEGILGASRRRGTIVLGETDSPQRLPSAPEPPLQYRQLPDSGRSKPGLYSGRTGGGFYTAIGPLAYPERNLRISCTNAEIRHASRNIIRIVGSNDLALDLLVSRVKYENPEITVQITAAGSLGGLLAIQEGKADMAGIHLLDEETGEYNYPYIKTYSQDMEVAVVHLADRIQGLMVAKGNPKHILSLEDLKRPDVTFVNRQKGSGTRVWLDYKLRELGILPHTIKGYTA